MDIRLKFIAIFWLFVKILYQSSGARPGSGKGPPNTMIAARPPFCDRPLSAPRDGPPLPAGSCSCCGDQAERYRAILLINQTETLRARLMAGPGLFAFLPYFSLDIYPTGVYNAPMGYNTV